MTNLERLQTIGIKRLGTPKRGFRYQSQNGRLTLADRQRIYELKIPPAWTDVAINPAAKGRLQVVGKDTAGRWQYLYHENHTRVQELRKFRRLTKFAQAIPQMRATVRRHLKQPGLGRERVLACMLRILSTCFMRPGSEAYASEHGSYGIATLRRKHVTVKGDVVEFDFPGKSGVRQYRQLEDRQVARVIRSLLKSSRLQRIQISEWRRKLHKGHRPAYQRVHQGSDGKQFQREGLPHVGRHTRLRVCVGP